MMDILSLIIFLVGVIATLASWYKIHHQSQIDRETEEKNKEILQTYNTLLEKEKILTNTLNQLAEQEAKYTEKIKELNSLTEDMNKSAAAAFSQYVDSLEASYKEKENEFENNIELLDNSYMNVQDEYIHKIDEVRQDLDKISATRAAAIEAQRKEQEIKNEKSFYSVQLTKTELNDVKTLRDIEYKLNNPRILRMLIWTTFYRDQMNLVCTHVLGPSITTGIYKITNQLNDMCYVGQSVDVAKRWKDHAKCGLGIDAPVGNLLYKAMQEDGLENFTFELLEECKQSELNEKEKYFIGLYQADKFGYNKTGGNK